MDLLLHVDSLLLLQHWLVQTEPLISLIISQWHSGKRMSENFILYSTVQIQLKQWEPLFSTGSPQTRDRVKEKKKNVAFLSLPYWFMKDNGTQFYKLKKGEERNDPFPSYESNTWPRGFQWNSLSSVNGLVIIKLWCSLSCLIRGCKMDSFLRNAYMAQIHL